MKNFSIVGYVVKMGNKIVKTMNVLPITNKIHYGKVDKENR